MDKPSQQITIHEAKKMMENPSSVIIDIRAQDAFQEAHIAGALNVHQDNLQNFLLSANRSSPLICYCYHGFSSQDAAQYFLQQGFQDVYSVEGGFEAWRLEYPVTTK